MNFLKNRRRIISFSLAFCVLLIIFIFSCGKMAPSNPSPGVISGILYSYDHGQTVPYDGQAMISCEGASETVISSTDGTFSFPTMEGGTRNVYFSYKIGDSGVYSKIYICLPATTGIPIRLYAGLPINDLNFIFLKAKMHNADGSGSLTINKSDAVPPIGNMWVVSDKEQAYPNNSSGISFPYTFNNAPSDGPISLIAGFITEESQGVYVGGGFYLTAETISDPMSLSTLGSFEISGNIIGSTASDLVSVNAALVHDGDALPAFFNLFDYNNQAVPLFGYQLKYLPALPQGDSYAVQMISANIASFLGSGGGNSKSNSVVANDTLPSIDLPVNIKMKTFTDITTSGQTKSYDFRNMTGVTGVAWDPSSKNLHWNTFDNGENCYYVAVIAKVGPEGISGSFNNMDSVEAIIAITPNTEYKVPDFFLIDQASYVYGVVAFKMTEPIDANNLTPWAYTAEKGAASLGYYFIYSADGTGTSALSILSKVTGITQKSLRGKIMQLVRRTSR